MDSGIYLSYNAAPGALDLSILFQTITFVHHTEVVDKSEYKNTQVKNSNAYDEFFTWNIFGLYSIQTGAWVAAIKKYPAIVI